MPSRQSADAAAMDQIMAVQLRILEQKMQHAKEAQRRAGTTQLQHEAQRRYEKAWAAARAISHPGSVIVGVFGSCGVFEEGGR